jgi:hypothetical protein
MPISLTVSQNQQITANHYNTIASAIRSLLINTYGSYADSFTVTQGSTITSEQWTALLKDVNRCTIHQTGNALTIAAGHGPDKGNKVYADFVNQVITAASRAVDNAVGSAGNQIASSTTNATSSRTTNWGSAIVMTVSFSWSGSNRDYWLALGGSLSASLSYSGGTNTAYDQQWKTLIDSANATLANAGYTYSGVNVNKTIPDANGNTIQITFVSGPGSVVATLTLTPRVAPSTFVDLTVTGNINYNYSSGSLGPTPYGVAAPPVVATLTSSFGTGGNVVQATKTLSVSPSSLNYTWYTGTTPATQTVTLTNNGNTTLTISGIQYTDNGNTKETASYAWTQTGEFSTIAISPNASVTFSLTYNQTTLSLGSFNNQITIISDNDAGPVSIPVGITVNAVPYDFEVIPSPVNATITTYNLVAYQFSCVDGLGGSHATYSATLTGANASSFTLDQSSPTGPLIKFDPTSVGNVNNNTVYSTTLSVTITGTAYGVTGTSTKTVPINLTCNVPANQNIGFWVSPLAYYDSVIGFSYDVIAGVKHITIGVGMGDGCPDLNNGGQPYVNVSNLNYAGDNQYTTNNLPLYAVSNGAWSGFLNTYGSWINRSGVNPVGAEMQRTYNFTTSVAGNCHWEMSVDNLGYFTIDDQLAGDLRVDGAGGYGNNFRGSIQGDIYLPAGNHTLVFYVTNQGGPAGIGIRVQDPGGAEVWTTRYPVRSNAPYQYWAEVYRIPLVNGQYTYNTYGPYDSYCVKDIGVVYGNRWGDYFQGRSICTVTDDGYGNLTIVVNPVAQGTGDTGSTTTIYDLQYSALFNGGDLASRYTQFDPGNLGPQSNQTNQFQGFNKSGAVITNLVTTPRSPPADPNSGGGSGSD